MCHTVPANEPSFGFQLHSTAVGVTVPSIDTMLHHRSAIPSLAVLLSFEHLSK
jgi:hypothetical protein